MKTLDADVLVVVPTYNERENLPLLAHSVLAHEGYGLLVVDDGSPDGTGDVADALAKELPGRVHVLHRTGTRGLARSYTDGLRHAVETSARLVCQMDADLSHDPQYLPALVAASDRFDLVIGSRYVPGGRVTNWPLRRIILSATANRYIRLVTRLDVHDCTSGFRCWRREALVHLSLGGSRAEGYAFLVEMLWVASRLGLTIGETPIDFVERQQGRSKLSAAVLLESAVVPWRLALGWSDPREGHGPSAAAGPDSPPHLS